MDSNLNINNFNLTSNSFIEPLTNTTLNFSGSDNTSNLVSGNSSFSYISFINNGTLTINGSSIVCDILVVGVNSDAWLVRKKGKAFMPFDERSNIVYALKDVDYVIDFDDSDGSAKDCIKRVRKFYPNDKIIFANGGDRTSANIPEMDIGDKNITFLFGIGGDYKRNSSSWILKKWEEQNV